MLLKLADDFQVACLLPSSGLSAGQKHVIGQDCSGEPRRDFLVSVVAGIAVLLVVVMELENSICGNRWGMGVPGREGVELSVPPCWETPLACPSDSLQAC